MRKRHALRQWPDLRRAASGHDVLVILVDYDGTLVPIAATPQQARMPASTRHLLARVRDLPGVRLGIVSGRSLQTVRRLVGVGGLIYVGNHGCEIEGPGLSFLHPAVRRGRLRLRRLAHRLRAALSGIRSVLIEDKGSSLSVHWRLMSPKDAPAFQRLLRREVDPWLRRRQVKLTRGKRVVEIRLPIDWDKGRSIEWVARNLPRTPARAIWYLGDDRTDEDAFRSVNRLRGVTIFVGPRPAATRARWWLRGPAEARELLRRIARVRVLRRRAG